MRIACIGSRDLNPEALGICRTLGQWIVKCGHHIYTGNALGADQAFAAGGNTADPRLVHLMLPWDSYERDKIVSGNQVLSADKLGSQSRAYYEGLARKYHPRYDSLSQGSQKLHLRNGMILIPDHPVDLVLAWPRDGANQGGTGQGLRLAQGEGIAWHLLNKMSREELASLCDHLEARPAFS